MKKMLLLLCFFVAVVTANANVVGTACNAETELLQNQTEDGPKSFITITLSCVEITYTNPNTVAVFFGLYALGLSDIVVANLERQWCSTTPTEIYA